MKTHKKDTRVFFFEFMVLSMIMLVQGCKNEAAASNYLEYQTKADLIVPLRGQSLVVHGGRSIEINAHASEKSQRFAIDVVALEPGSSSPNEAGISVFEVLTYQRDKNINENYYIYGREVVAPADGMIVSTFDEVDDAIPSESHHDYNNPAGNNIVIDHGNNEYSLIGHLKRGSLVVKEGDVVEQGDVIGSVGNSGNSTEPHLHYHLQNTSRWLDGEGLPAQFQRYFSNGIFVERGEPIRGQIIENNVNM